MDSVESGLGHVMQRTLSREKSSQLLKALSDPIRLDVITALADGERCVCDLTRDLKLTQSRLSFHLKVLRNAELVNDRKSGRWIFYRLNANTIGELQSWIGSLAVHCNKAAPTQHCADGAMTTEP